MMIRKTKIVCTIGPSTGDPRVLRELIRAGMDVARLNFSHGDLPVFEQWIRAIREEASAQGRHVAILQDLPGPKLRIGSLKAGTISLADGATFVLRTRPEDGTEQAVRINYPKLPREVAVGDPIFLDDGRIQLKVVRTADEEIETEVIEGGPLRGGAGINVPQSALSIRSVSERDLAYLDFGLAHGVDWVAISFVRSADDLDVVRARCKTAKRIPGLIAKIERREALERLEEIVAASDGVMVARGDLGVEIPVEQVPMAQKRIIGLANRTGKPVITATQMLESMVEHPRPTRAEVTDVANAVLDGTDAVMLSQETSIGTHPLEAVRMMDRLTREVEDHISALHTAASPADQPEDVSEAVVHGASHIAGEIKASAIVAITRTGRTAERFSRARPKVPIVALVSDDAIAKRLVMYRGVIPLVVEHLDGLDQTPETLFDRIRGGGMVTPGDQIVLTGGIPSGEPGSTSFLRVFRIPKTLERNE